jgi:hypothetical protein
MSERIKGRRVITYFYNDLEQLISQVETTSEPVEQEAAPEFVGVTQTQSLTHGHVPQGEGWAVYKLYEKVVIWMLRPTSAVKEASP